MVWRRVDVVIWGSNQNRFGKSILPDDATSVFFLLVVRVRETEEQFLQLRVGG